jgi:hypothetical protein
MRLYDNMKYGHTHKLSPETYNIVKGLTVDFGAL